MSRIVRLLTLTLVRLANQSLCRGPWNYENTIPLSGSHGPNTYYAEQHVNMKKLYARLKRVRDMTKNVVIDPDSLHSLRLSDERFSFIGQHYLPVKVTKRPGAYEMLAVRDDIGAISHFPVQSPKELHRIVISIEEPRRKQPHTFTGVTEEMYSDLVGTGYYKFAQTGSPAPAAEHSALMSLRSHIYTTAGAKRDLYFRNVLRTKNMRLGNKVEKQPAAPEAVTQVRELVDASSRSRSRHKRRLLTISNFDDNLTVDEFRTLRTLQSDMVYKKTWRDNSLVQRAQGRLNRDREKVRAKAQPKTAPIPRFPEPRKEQRVRFKGMDGIWQKFKRAARDITVNALSRTRVGRKVLEEIQGGHFRRNKELAAQGEELLRVAIAGYEELDRVHQSGVVMGKITKDSVLIQYDKDSDRYEIKFRDFRAARRSNAVPSNLDVIHRGNMHNIPYTREKDMFEWATVIQYLQGRHSPGLKKRREALLRTKEHFLVGNKDLSFLNTWDRTINADHGHGDVIQSLFTVFLATRKSPMRAHHTARVTYNAVSLTDFLRSALTSYQRFGWGDFRLLPLRHPEKRMLSWRNKHLGVLLDFALHFAAQGRIRPEDRSIMTTLHAIHIGQKED